MYEQKKISGILKMILSPIIFWFFARALGSMSFFSCSLFFYFAYKIKGKPFRFSRILFPFSIFAGVFFVLRNYTVYRGQLYNTLIYLTVLCIVIIWHVLKKSGKIAVLPGKHYEFLYPILILALFLRLFFIIKAPIQPITSDCAAYHDYALNLLNNNEFRHGNLKADRPPLYPFFLCCIYKVFGVKQVPVYLIQALLDTITVLMVFFMGTWAINPRAGLLASFLAALHPYLILLTRIYFTQTLATFLLVASFLCLTYILCKNRNGGQKRYKNDFLLFVSGAFLGLSTLAHPDPIALPAMVIIVFIAVFWKEKGKIIRYSFIYSMGFLITLSPWMIRNYMVFKKVVSVTTRSGLAFVVGNYMPTKGLVPNREEIREDLFEKTWVTEGEVNSNKILMKKGIENIKNYIKTNPEGYIQFLRLKFTRLWKIPLKNVNRKYNVPYDFKVVFHRFLNFFVIAGFFFSYRYLKQLLPSLLLLLYWTVIHLAVHALPVYAVPAIPFLILFASLGIISTAEIMD